MKRSLIITGIVLFVVAALYTGMPVLEAQYSSLNYKEIGGARLVIGGDIDIVDGGEINIEDGGDLFMEPTDDQPTAEIGWVYFDLSETALAFHDGSGWVYLSAGTGDNTLDLAYDQGSAGAGRKIDADTGAVEIEVDDNADNPALHLDGNNVSDDPTVLLIENIADAANAISIDIDAQSTGRDIEGTGATWHVTGAGVLTATSAAIPIMTGGQSFSDEDLANIGEIAVDDIISDASSDVMWVLKTVIKTIDLDDDGSGTDFTFDDDAANSTAQAVNMGNLVPTYGELVSVQVRCVESIGAGTFDIKLGTGTGGNQLLTSTALDAAGETGGTAATAGPVIAATSSVVTIWIEGDPSGNWADAGDAGIWAVMVTYIDYGAVWAKKQ